ncbi:MAG: glycerophosphodiester phosphodiesterase [Casimicrobiaceae bacterium]
MKPTQVVAHRGSSAHHPDNSWSAFHAAVAERADCIECDVQATRDGILILRHDLGVDDRMIADLSYAEIEARLPGLVILGEFIAWAQHAKIALLVEVKDPDATAAVAAVISASPWRNEIVLGGFHGPALAAAKVQAPKLKTSFMIGSVMATEDMVRLAAAYRVDGVHLCWEARAARPHQLVDREVIDRLRRAKLAITLWHEERVDELRALVGLEPDAICTNTPAVLRRIVDSLCAVAGASTDSIRTRN